MLDCQHARRLTEIAAGGISGRGPSGLCNDDLWGAALDLIGAAKSISIITGFFIPSAHAPETDGPPGSVTLARALIRSGCLVEIWTDFRCAEALSACAEAIGFPENGVIDISNDIENTKLPDLLIYVERLGRASDGRYYDMGKNDVSAFAPPLDDFALRGSCGVIGIGDGGNEVGMGNYKTSLEMMMPNYAECISSVKADVSIPADVSNWGAYALSAALSIAEGKWLAQTEEEEIEMMKALSRIGAVDGVKKIPSLSVDGFDISKQLEICSALRNLL